MSNSCSHALIQIIVMKAASAKFLKYPTRRGVPDLLLYYAKVTGPEDEMLMEVSR
jgi:hypothetical protein